MPGLSGDSAVSVEATTHNSKKECSEVREPLLHALSWEEPLTLKLKNVECQMLNMLLELLLCEDFNISHCILVLVVRCMGVFESKRKAQCCMK